MIPATSIAAGGRAIFDIVPSALQRSSRTSQCQRWQPPSPSDDPRAGVPVRRKAAGARAAWSVWFRFPSYDHAARATLGRSRREAGATQKADVERRRVRVPGLQVVSGSPAPSDRWRARCPHHKHRSQSPRAGSRVRTPSWSAERPPVPGQRGPCGFGFLRTTTLPGQRWVDPAVRRGRPRRPMSRKQDQRRRQRPAGTVFTAPAAPAG